MIAVVDDTNVFDLSLEAYECLSWYLGRVLPLIQNRPTLGIRAANALFPDQL